MRRNEHLLEHLLSQVPKSAPGGAASLARFTAGEPPTSVAEALRHHLLDQKFPKVAPGHADALLVHRRLFSNL